MKNRAKFLLFALSFVVFAFLLIVFVQKMQGNDAHGGLSKESTKQEAKSPNSLLSEPPRIFSAAWLDALPPQPDLSEEEHCLAEAIYFEARGEPVHGQIAVAEVILNRVQSERFPDTICDVVYQGSHRRNACQFSYACDGVPEWFNDREAHDRAERLAAYLTKGGDAGFARGAEFYHAVTVQPSWAARLQEVAKIGDHIFLRYPEVQTLKTTGRQ